MMAITGRVWVTELNKYVDVFDAPESVPDSYAGQHVAVPESTVPSSEKYLGGVAIMRQGTTAGSYGHPTLLDGEPGIAPIIYAAIASLALITISLIVLYFMMTYSATKTVNYVKDGQSCTYYVVTQGISAPHALDTCGNTWGPWEGGGLGDTLNTLGMVVIVGVAAYIGIKYILPELGKLGSKKSA